MFAQVVSDQELINRYLSGDEICLEQLINRHKSKVFSYIQMVIKDKQTADDIFQDTFIKVIHTLKSGTYKEEGKFIQWVMRIAHNLVIDFFRKAKRIPIVDCQNDEYNILDNLRVYDESIEDRIIMEQIHQDIRRMIDFLPSEQREVLIMRHYADMSFKDIAEQTDVSINTALGRMRYALINLRKMMERKEIKLSL
jgi:RNA polymerase sigma-70 factor (ECF subfamily)